MIIITLSILLLILFVLGLLESYNHTYYLNKIPNRIHVNGARGKSSVARLIASGIRESGSKVLAKTTGSSPRIIDEMVKILKSTDCDQLQLVSKYAL